MRISGEGTIGILLALVGLAGAGAIMIAPQHVEIGWCLIVLAAIGFTLLGYHHKCELLGWRPVATARRHKALSPFTVMQPNTHHLGISATTVSGAFDTIGLRGDKVAWTVSVALSNLGPVPLIGCCLYLESIKPNPIGIGPIRLIDPNTILDVGAHIPIEVAYVYLEGRGDNLVRRAALNNPHMPEYKYDTLGIPLGIYDITLRATADGTLESVATFRLRVTSNIQDLSMERREV